MKVRATQDGFYDGSIIQAGQVFEFKGSKLGKWMVEVDKKPDAKERRIVAEREESKKPHEPVALSEITKGRNPHASKADLDAK